MRRLGGAGLILAVVSMLLATGCGDDDDASGSEAITLYTCANDTMVQLVIKAFESKAGTKVELFRAPTGELTVKVSVAVDAFSASAKDAIVAAGGTVSQD